METIKKEYFYNPKTDDIEQIRKEIGIEEIDECRIISQNWIKMNNKYYYLKKLDNYNELAGEIYAKALDLKTAHYELVKYPFHNILKHDLYYASENFLKPNIKYIKMYNIFPERYTLITDSLTGEKGYARNDDEVDENKKLLPSNFNGYEELKKMLSKENYKILEDQLVKQASVDIFMRQYDRCCVNMIFEQNKNDLYLGPTYDYTGSLDFEDDSTYYYNDIQDIPYTKRDLRKFIKQHPQMNDYLKELCKVDLVEELKKELRKYKIRLSDTEEYTYTTESGISECRVKKIIK